VTAILQINVLIRPTTWDKLYKNTIIAKFFLLKKTGFVRLRCFSLLMAGLTIKIEHTTATNQISLCSSTEQWCDEHRTKSHQTGF
jgi:hypothetical protein